MHNQLKWKTLIEGKKQVLAETNKHVQKSSFKIRADPHENDVWIMFTKIIQGKISCSSKNN